ncbi:MAG: sugar-binding domain-containing protein [Oscillospiraceae bacterium]
MYYEQGKTQNEIAAFLKVSRPLVSRYLDEARQCGIVHIQVNNPLETNNVLASRLYNFFDIHGTRTVVGSLNSNDTNRSIAGATIGFLENAKPHNLSIGWGSIIGDIVNEIEGLDSFQCNAKNVAPLVGNSGVFNKNYHSSELVRVLSQKMNAVPHYWYAPAFVESQQEAEQLRSLENYRDVCGIWNKLDVAVVNIGNYPSVPDFATGARYGDKLKSEKAVGRLLCYYFNQQGKIIQGEGDSTMQIPIETLIKARCVLGVAASNVKPRALLGALNTGVFTHLVAAELLVQETLKLRQG